MACKVLHNACLDGVDLADVEELGGLNMIEKICNSLDELVDVVEDIVNDEEEERHQDEYDDNDNDLELERHFLEVGSSLLKLLSPYNVHSDDSDLVPLSDQEDDTSGKTNKNMNKK